MVQSLPWPDMGYRGPSWSRAWGWGMTASVWWPGLCPWGSAQSVDMGPPSRGLTTCRRGQKVWVQEALVGGRMAGTLAVRSWAAEASSRRRGMSPLWWGRNQSRLSEIKKFQLDIVGLTSTHGRGVAKGTSQGGWTRYHSGVADSERRRAGVANLVAPQLGACTLEFTLVSERVVCTDGSNISSAYPPFLESLEGVLENAPLGDYLVLLGDFNAHVGSDSETGRGVVGKNAPLTWTRAVFYCWTFVLVMDCL